MVLVYVFFVADGTRVLAVRVGLLPSPDDALAVSAETSESHTLHAENVVSLPKVICGKTLGRQYVFLFNSILK